MKPMKRLRPEYVEYCKIYVLINSVLLYTVSIMYGIIRTNLFNRPSTKQTLRIMVILSKFFY